MNYLRVALCLMEIESGGKTDAVGDNGRAVGPMQLHEIAVEDVNRVFGSRFRPQDRADKMKSLAIAIRYLMVLGDHYRRQTGNEPTVRALARQYNGGPTGWAKRATEDYGIRAEALYRTVAPARERAALEALGKAGLLVVTDARRNAENGRAVPR